MFMETRYLHGLLCSDMVAGLVFMVDDRKLELFTQLEHGYIWASDTFIHLHQSV